MSNEDPTDALRLVPDDHEVIKRCVERMPPLYMRGQTEGPYLHSDIAGLTDIIGRLAAAPASPLPEGGGWQDISTAPKDGTRFLWCRLDDLDGNAGMHVVFWEQGEFRYASDHEKFVGDPVDSWMPLPAAPTGEPK